MVKSIIKITLVFFLSSVQTACGQSYKQINVTEYGAKGDGITNDSQSINAAFSQVYKTGGTVYFPAGSYLTDLIDIRPSGGVTVEIKGDKNKTTLIKNPKDKSATALFFCEVPDVSLTFSDLKLEGSSSRTQNRWKQVAGQESYDIESPIRGIFVYNLKQLKVFDCSVKNFHGDGISAYSTKQFIAYHNQVESVNGTGIKGHRVINMDIHDNIIKDTGFIPQKFMVGGQIKSRSTFFPKTTFGDGIEGDCETLVAKNNTIINPGRCGIVHDLAIDLGYKNSSATITGNSIIVNSAAINNNNPPSGMWFEQSANVTVQKNNIQIIHSTSKLVTAIRLYGITNSIYCKDNSLEATKYNHVLDNGIGIFEPKLSTVNIESNKIFGNFAAGIAFSNEGAHTYMNELKIQQNKISGQNTAMKHAIYMYTGKQASTPKRQSISKNDFFNVVSESIYRNAK